MKQKEIKKLTWEYFIDQKICEIFGFIFPASIFLLILYTLGRLDYLGVCENYCSSFLIAILVGLTSLLLTAIILALAILVLLMLSYVLYVLFINPLRKWIESNWEKAKKKAREELR